MYCNTKKVSKTNTQTSILNSPDVSQVIQGNEWGIKGGLSRIYINNKDTAISMQANIQNQKFVKRWNSNFPLSLTSFYSTICTYILWCKKKKILDTSLVPALRSAHHKLFEEADAQSKAKYWTVPQCKVGDQILYPWLLLLCSICAIQRIASTAYLPSTIPLFLPPENLYLSHNKAIQETGTSNHHLRLPKWSVIMSLQLRKEAKWSEAFSNFNE